ncbi:fimbrial protein [Pseudomonas synxantha]|uniref:fimbrial protein n=1 Tax=Pseudomonas synxantha TaxID=47883 RepID=UPI003B97A082
MPQKLQVGSGLSVVFYYKGQPINGARTWLGFLSSSRDNVFKLTYDLVRSEGPVAAGDLYAGGVRAEYEYSSGSGSIHGTVTGRAALGTCLITTPNIHVAMPEVTSSELPTVGSTFGEVFFNIGISCDSSSKVYAEFTDSNSASNSGDSLGLGAGSTAKGIRFQVLHDGVLVRYKQRRALGDIQSGGQISMSARYIRDGNLVPGRAVAQSTYIVSYD